MDDVMSWVRENAIRLYAHVGSYDGIDTSFLSDQCYPARTRRCNDSTFELMCSLEKIRLSANTVPKAGNFKIAASLTPLAQKLQSFADQSVSPKRLFPKHPDSYGFKVQANKRLNELSQRVDIPENDTTFRLLHEFITGLEAEAKRVAPNSSPKKRPIEEVGLSFPTVGTERRKKAPRHKSFYER